MEGEGIIQIVINIPTRIERLLVLPVLLYRRLRYGYAFRKIPLTKGMHAIVDTDDYYRLSEYKWYTTGRCYNQYYAVRKIAGRKGKKGKTIQMHREVANTPDGLMCDHINGRTLDNRKANLRSVTPSQNVWNSRKYVQAGYSKYKGVTFDKKRQKWMAQICVHRRPIYLGSFEEETRATKAYDKAAKKHFGEFAVLNFPD